MVKRSLGGQESGKGYFDSDKSDKVAKRGFFLFFLFFIGLVFFLFYYAFPGMGIDIGNGVIGKVVGSNFIGNSTHSNDIKVNANLNPSKISISGKVDKIELIANVDKFKFGNQDFNLKDRKTSIVIDNFDGKFSFDGINITDFKGKANKVYVDGLPVSSSKPLEVSFNSGSYNYLKLTNFYLSSLSYVTSGRVAFNDDRVVINLVKEDISLVGFKGNLESRSNKFILIGNVKKSNVAGSLDVSLS